MTHGAVSWNSMVQHPKRIVMLPTELERQIFILATDSAQRAFSFLVVAQRVHSWMETLLYQKVVLSNEITANRFLSSMRLRPSSLSEGVVQSLCIEGDVLLTTAADILSLCGRTKNLALWIPPSDLAGEPSPLLHSLNALPLTSLSLSISHVFDHPPVISLSTIPVFSKLSHLEIHNGWVLWSSTVGLEHLQQLTHLCLHVHTKRTKPTLVMSLLRNLHLQVLVFRTSEDLKTVQGFLEHTGLIDPCIVLVNYALVDLNDFRSSDITSLWRNAEQIVKQRRAINQAQNMAQTSHLLKS